MTDNGKRAHDVYPIRTVARMTGLSPDLIRVWEKRYRVVHPVRGPRGARLYTSADIDHLRLLARAVSGGRAIGDVAGFDAEELRSLSGGGGDLPRMEGAAAAVEALLHAVERFDATAADRQLGDALVALGISTFAREVASPLLIEVGQRAMDGRLSIADEHMLSALMRSLLSSILRSRGQSRRPVVLLATPSGERHEFGLLLTALRVLDAGLGLCYLGIDLPADQIASAARRANVVVAGVGVVDSGNRECSAAEIRRVEQLLDPASELWIGGRDASAVVELIAPTRALLLDEIPLLERELGRLSAAPAVRP